MFRLARSRRVETPARSAQAQNAGLVRRAGKPPVGWHLAEAGLLALAVTGGLALLSGGRADRPPEAARRADPKTVAAQPPAKPERPAPIAAPPAPPSAPARQAADPGQPTPAPAPAGDPPSLSTLPVNSLAPAIVSPPYQAAPEPAPRPGPADAAAPLQASAPDLRSEPTESGEARPGASAYDEQAAKGGITAPAEAPTACLPGALRAVLADVAGRYGPLTVVSSQRLNTRNHATGSARHKMHQACKAVDFRMQKPRSQDVVTYLRSRPEVGGVEAYRDGVIHIDSSETQVGGQPRPRPTARIAPAQAQ